MKQVPVPRWVDIKRLKDPMFWFMKAWSYSSASHYIMDEFQKIKDGDKLDHRFNAINSVPYLTGLAAELFMKGYLVSKGISHDELRNKNHDLKTLREMCLKYDDRFNTKELVFLTDRLGDHIMKDGGIRYPDKIPMAVYFDEFKISLELLQKITGEIEKKLVKVWK